MDTVSQRPHARAANTGKAWGWQAWARADRWPWREGRTHAGLGHYSTLRGARQRRRLLFGAQAGSRAVLLVAGHRTDRQAREVRSVLAAGCRLPHTPTVSLVLGAPALSRAGMGTKWCCCVAALAHTVLVKQQSAAASANGLCEAGDLPAC